MYGKLPTGRDSAVPAKDLQLASNCLWAWTGVPSANADIGTVITCAGEGPTAMCFMRVPHTPWFSPRIGGVAPGQVEPHRGTGYDALRNGFTVWLWGMLCYPC